LLEPEDKPRQNRFKARIRVALISGPSHLNALTRRALPDRKELEMHLENRSTLLAARLCSIDLYVRQRTRLACPSRSRFAQAGAPI
jgi:hypothetical protein